MKKLLFFFAISFPLLGYAQTTALPLPTEMHYVYLNLYSQSCNYGVDLIETDIGQNALPGVTYFQEEIVSPMYCPSNNDFCPGSMHLVFSQVGNKWYRNNSLWFDWDKQVGDTCQLDYNGYEGVNCLITGIDTIVFADFIPRRQYHIVDLDSGQEMMFYGQTFTFIEGIGTNLMGLEYYTSETDQRLSCVFDKNGLQLIQNEWSSYVGCCNTNSVNELSSNSFSIYPSPATDHTSLLFEAAHIPHSIQIFNATGQLMHIEKVLGRMQIQLNVSEYAKGIYTIRARFENGEEVSERLVVE